MDARRVIWTVIVLGFLTLSVSAVVTIARENLADDDVGGRASGTVVMADIAYEPATITVAKGSEVLFDNQDVAPHTVTSEDGEVGSGLLDPGKAFKLVAEEGFKYHCDLHPAMTGEVRIEG